mgnify:CR=1 FL=1
MTIWFWLAVWYSAAGTLTFALFAWDKLAAKAQRRRVPERTLHTAELLGGWPGALAAISFLRHKSSKPRFLVVTGEITLLHLAVCAAGALWQLGMLR